MSTISTHILDTAMGRPAQAVEIKLELVLGQERKLLAQGKTNSDGRMPELATQVPKIDPGQYCMKFEVADYFDKQGKKAFYPFVEVMFEISAADEHYHIPLLLSPFAFSTYRGS